MKLFIHTLNVSFWQRLYNIFEHISNAIDSFHIIFSRALFFVL